MNFRHSPQEVQRIRVAPIELSAKELASYSITRAIDAAREGDRRLAPFEYEVSDESFRRAGTQSQHGEHAVLVPPAVLAQRDLTVASASGGGYLASDSPVLGVVDALRPISVVMKAGAQSLTGLVPNATLARQGGTSTLTWQSTEATQATETATYTLASIAVSSKTVCAYVEHSRLLRLQSPDLAEAMTRRELRLSLATAIDAAALGGSGASGQPLGVIGTSGIGTFTGTSVSYSALIEAQSDIGTANALTEGGAVSFVTTPAVASLLAQRDGFSANAPLWVGPLAQGKLVECPAWSTGNMPMASIMAGDFSQLLVVEFGGGAEIRVNPYANFQSGLVGYAVFLSLDVAVLQPTGFSVATSVT